MQLSEIQLQGETESLLSTQNLSRKVVIKILTLIMTAIFFQSVYNHGILSSLKGSFNIVLVDPDIGKSNHYRDTVAKGYERAAHERMLKVTLDNPR